MNQNSELPSLILASISPRREELLSTISFPFHIIDSGIEETLSGRHSPAATASILASRKAEAVARRICTGIVLAADTVIDFRKQLWGKPDHYDHALKMLQMLRGEPHNVITALAVLNKCEGLKVVSTVVTEVRMRDYRDDEIREYLETGEPFDKAGSYAIQGLGGRLVDSTSGCYNNVIGLPLCETVELLRFVGLPLSEQTAICCLPSGKTCPRVR